MQGTWVCSMALFYIIQTQTWLPHYKNHYKHFVNMEKSCQIPSTQTAQSPLQKSGMEDVLDDLNGKSLDQCHRCLSKDKTVADEHDIDTKTDHMYMYPTDQKAICMLTIYIYCICIRNWLMINSKRRRQFFLLCSMMLCIDNRYSMPSWKSGRYCVSDPGTQQTGVRSPQETLKRFIQNKVHVDTKMDKHHM